MNQIAKEWQDYEVIDTVNKEKLELFKNNKVNRISIGVQSFNNKIW